MFKARGGCIEVDREGLLLNGRERLSEDQLWRGRKKIVGSKRNIRLEEGLDENEAGWAANR